MAKSICFETVSKRKRKRLLTLLGIGDLDDFRSWAGLNQPELGYLVGMEHPNGHGKRAYSRAAVNNWLAGRAHLTEDVQVAITRLAQKFAEGVDVRAVVDVRFLRFRAGQPAPMKIKIKYRCACGRVVKDKPTRCKHKPL